jgi:hypothetical protein
MRLMVLPEKSPSETGGPGHQAWGRGKILARKHILLRTWRIKEELESNGLLTLIPIVVVL